MSACYHSIRKHPFSAELSDKQVEILASMATCREVEQGQLLLRKGEAAERFFLLETGEVVIEISNPVHGDLKIQTLSPGDIIGWSWLIPPHILEFDAQTTEYSKVIELKTAPLRAAMEADHDLGYRLLQQMIVQIVSRLRLTRIQYWDIYKMHYLMRGNV